MRTFTPTFLLVLLGLALRVRCEEAAEDGAHDEEDDGILECVFEDNTADCLRTRLARDLDQIEREVTGKKAEPTISAVVEQAGGVIAEVVDDLQNTGAEGVIGEDEAQDDEIGKNPQASGRSFHLSRVNEPNWSPVIVTLLEASDCRPFHPGPSSNRFLTGLSRRCG